MDQLIDNGLVADHLLNFVPLQHKLRLRYLNSNFKDAVESWLWRYNRTLGPKELVLTNEQMMKLLELSRTLDAIVIDRGLDDELWQAAEDHVNSVKTVCFALSKVACMSWLERINFQKVEWQRTIFSVSFDQESSFSQVLEMLSQCPHLDSIHFQNAREGHGHLGNRLFNCFTTDLGVPLSLKVKELPFWFVHDPTELRHLLDTFPNLETLGVEFTVHRHRVDYSLQEEFALALKGSRCNSIQHLKLAATFYMEDILLSAFIEKWPNLKSLVICEYFRKTLVPIMWDLSMFLDRFPRLESLGLESGDCITIAGRKKLVPLLTLNPSSQKKYPLKSFYRPVAIEASQLLWLLIHCPHLRKLDLEDVVMDIDPENILRSPLLDGKGLAKNLRHLKFRSMKNYAFPQFNNLIKVFSHIKTLHVEIKEDKYPLHLAHLVALQGSVEEARAALKSIGLFLENCPKLERLCIVDHLYDRPLLKLLTQPESSFPEPILTTFMKIPPHLSKVELHAGFPF